MIATAADLVEGPRGVVAGGSDAAVPPATATGGQLPGPGITLALRLDGAERNPVGRAPLAPHRARRIREKEIS